MNSTQLSGYSLTRLNKRVALETSVLLVVIGVEWNGSYQLSVLQMDELQQEFGSAITVEFVDFHASHELMAEYGISKPPAILFFSQGLLRDKLLETTPKDIIHQKITQLL